jgi:hypothetical protein
MTSLEGPLALAVLTLSGVALVLVLFGNTPLALLLAGLVICGTLVDLTCD